MANSRRRERELARRRHERRRLRDQQIRARRRRRNTIAGAAAGTGAVIALVVFLAVHYSGSSTSTTAADSVSSTPTPSTAATPTPTATTAPAVAPKHCAPIKPNPPVKGDPRVPPVTGKAPTKLVVHDLKKGHGPAAKAGSKLEVNYVGVACSTGQQFDASYPRHQTFPFTLGQGAVIQGWDKGLVGMRQGGRRELVIPGSLAYGPAGTNGIKGNETLIFVVDLVKVS